MVLRPEAFATRILFSQPQDKGCNLLFDFLQREFLIVPHPQIFLDRIVFAVRHIDRAVGVESQTPGNVSGILSVGLDPICIGNAHGGRREDDAFDTVVCELMIERITKASGLISADEFHFFRIFLAHLLQIFQYKPVVGGYRLPVFDLIPVKAVAAKCVVFFMDIHSYPEAPGQLEVKYSSISEIVGDATDIVKVSILEQTVEMLDEYPQTHTTVQVHETYKGDVSVGENLVVIEEGGQDNKVMGGIPQMSKNSKLYSIPYRI